MDRAFIRSLVKFCAENAKAGEIVHNTIRATNELTARGRKPSEKELDALTDYTLARAEAEAAEAAKVDAED